MHYPYCTQKGQNIPIALRKAKIVNNFGLSDCNRVKSGLDGLCVMVCTELHFFSSPEPKAPGELIGWEGSVVRRPSVVRRSSVHNYKRLLL